MLSFNPYVKRGMKEDKLGENNNNTIKQKERQFEFLKD